jgi:hypothetical protein
MKRVIASICFLLLDAYNSSAQGDTVSVHFEVDGMQTSFIKGKTQFIYNGDTVSIDM